MIPSFQKSNCQDQKCWHVLLDTCTTIGILPMTITMRLKLLASYIWLKYHNYRNNLLQNNICITNQFENNIWFHVLLVELTYYLYVIVFYHSYYISTKYRQYKSSNILLQKLFIHVISISIGKWSAECYCKVINKRV